MLGCRSVRKNHVFRQFLQLETFEMRCIQRRQSPRMWSWSEVSEFSYLIASRSIEPEKKTVSRLVLPGARAALLAIQIPIMLVSKSVHASTTANVAMLVLGIAMRWLWYLRASVADTAWDVQLPRLAHICSSRNARRGREEGSAPLRLYVLFLDSLFLIGLCVVWQRLDSQKHFGIEYCWIRFLPRLFVLERHLFYLRVIISISQTMASVDHEAVQHWFDSKLQDGEINYDSGFRDADPKPLKPLWSKHHPSARSPFLHHEKHHPQYNAVVLKRGSRVGVRGHGDKYYHIAHASLLYLQKWKIYKRTQHAAESMNIMCSRCAVYPLHHMFAQFLDEYILSKGTVSSISSK